MDVMVLGVSGRAVAVRRGFRLSDHGADTDVVVVLDAQTVDRGGSPPTQLRKGLVLGRITETGRYKHYDPDASDGTEVARLILLHDVDMRDGWLGDSRPREQFARGMQHGVVDEALLHGCDQAAKAALDAVIFM